MFSTDISSLSRMMVKRFITYKVTFFSQKSDLSRRKIYTQIWLFIYLTHLRRFACLSKIPFTKP